MLKCGFSNSMLNIILIAPLIYFVFKTFNKKEESKEESNDVFNFIDGIYNDITGSGISGVNDKWDDLFRKYGEQENVSPKLLKTIAMNESWLGEYSGNEPIGNTSGLMHIKLSTAQDFGDYNYWSFSDLNPYRDENQIEAAAKYLKYLSGLFNGDEKKIVMSYNQGQGNTLAGKNYAQDYWDRYNRNKERLV